MVPGQLKVPLSTGYKYEMSTCAEFFSLSPGDRWSKIEKGKICYACIQPKDICVNQRCSFEAKVPETLKCQGCTTWAMSKNLAPLPILFCKRKEHANLRAPFPEMKKDLEKYLGSLGGVVMDSLIMFAANFTFQVFSMGPGANALGWNQKKSEDKPAPSIDSETGKNIDVDPECIIPEVLEHSCYLMQTIKIESTEALVFFLKEELTSISFMDAEGIQ